MLGSGRWASFLAAYHARRNEVMLWGREGSASFERLRQNRCNDYLELPENVNLTSNLEEAINFADYIVISISAQALREFCGRLNKYKLSGKTFILCMKGIEIGTGERLLPIVKSTITQDISVCVWVGPGHVQDFMRGIPNCMVVDSDDAKVTEDIINKFSGDLIRLYIGNDIIGTEIGAAAKNVVGIAAGMLDGLGYSSLKGALMARGAREVSRLIRAMGGNELTAYGLSHLGDYEATLFSEFSQNRRFGELFVNGEKYSKLAEGAATVKALMQISEKFSVELPISNAVYECIYSGKEPKKVLFDLFKRDVKTEFQN